MIKPIFYAAALAGTMSCAAPAFAATELITNGNFTYSTSATTVATSSTQMTNSNVYGWSLSTTPGYTFIYVPGAGTSGSTADTTGASGQYGNVALWGPGNGSPNGLSNSPAGGTFLALDDNYQSAAVRQTVNGLTVGSTYDLSFYFAGAQQYGFNNATQHKLTVTFGDQTQSTNQIEISSHSFSGWSRVNMSFVASSTNQTLSFLASGTPGGAPPFSLLDGVSLQASSFTPSVPEPASWALMIMGFGLVGFSMRYGMRRSNAKFDEKVRRIASGAQA